MGAILRYSWLQENEQENKKTAPLPSFPPLTCKQAVSWISSYPQPVNEEQSKRYEKKKVTQNVILTTTTGKDCRVHGQLRAQVRVHNYVLGSDNALKTAIGLHPWAESPLHGYK